MVSSAIYRYVPSRDALLTLLIIEAYNDLGATVEAAVAESVDQPPATRWVAAAAAIRSWAIEHVHDYSLIYGTPIRGYEAPLDTIGPASRVTTALITLATDAFDRGLLHPPEPRIAVSSTLAADAEAIGDQLGGPLPAEVMVRVVTAWSQLFGLLGFELFGQTKNAVTDDADLFATSARAMAGFIGLDNHPA